MHKPAVRYTEHDDMQQQPMATPGMATPGMATPMVERTFRLLDTLSNSDDGMTLSELARALEISKGSLHGLLKSLEHLRVIEQAADRRYVVGPRIYGIARAYSQRTGLRRFALPGMRRLAAEIGETVFLGRIERDSVRVIARWEAENDPTALHISAAPGARIPLLAAALGRVILAAWPPASREEYLRGHPLPRFTDQSSTDSDAFLATVAATAQSGIGMDHEEYLAGVNAVAAPIRGLGGSLAGLLWVVGFATRFGDEAMSRAAELLHAEAEAIAQALEMHR